MSSDNADADYTEYNKAARSTCRAQLKAGEITEEDFRWLAGSLPKDPTYLLPMKRQKRAHILIGGDTACKAISGGALNVGHYKRSKTLGRARLCDNCRSAAQ